MAKAKKAPELSPSEFNDAARATMVEVSTEAALAARLERARAEAEAFIESKVQELKASEEGRLLPIDWLRQNLRALNGGHCDCKVALALLEKNHDG